MEVSQGCQHNCTGCKIDKNHASMPDEQTMKKLHGMFDEMDRAGMDFYEIELGPTDMISAANHAEIFGNELLRDLASMFKITTVNSSFIHPHKEQYQKFAKTLHEFAPDNWVGLAIPLEMKHVFNDKYIDLIRENVRIFQESLPNFLKEVVLTVIFDETYMQAVGRKHTFDELFERCNSLSVHQHTMVDFIFHHGRQNIKSEFVAQSLKTSIEALNKHYLIDVKKRGNDIRYRHVPAQMLPESHNNELVFSDGKLYVRPVLNERVTVFHEHMLFEGDWSLDNFRLQTINRLNQNLELAANHADCSGCDFQVECASNYVQDLLHVVNSDKCLLLKRELKAFDLERDFKL